VPSAYNTKPPPLAIEFDTQAPTPLVGTLARRLPAMLNPPAGGLTGAIPFGGIGHVDPSVNDVTAVRPEDAPSACAEKPCPRKLCCTRRSPFEKVPSARTVAKTLPSQKNGSTLV